MNLIEQFLSHLPAVLPFGGWTQESRLMRLSTAQSGIQLLVEEARIVEDLESNFRIDLAVLSTDAAIPLESLIGQPVLLELLTSQSRTDLRPFHGHITHSKALGANGGLARYHLTIQAWTAFLAHTQDSAIYQDMTVFDIIDAVASKLEGQGTLKPQWRMDITDQSLYTKRSLTTQYQESDFAFLQRLLQEEGLFGWIEHQGNNTSHLSSAGTNNTDQQANELGSHTWVIADHNGAFHRNAQSQVPFTQAGAVMKQDSIDQWHSVRQWQTSAITQQSWDYRQIHNRPVANLSNANNLGSDNQSAHNTPMTRQDSLGAYHYTSRSHGQRQIERQLQALEAHNKRFQGGGTVRSFAPGTSFSLIGHAEHDLFGVGAMTAALSEQREQRDEQKSAQISTQISTQISDQTEQTDNEADNHFLITSVIHHAHNNLTAELKAGLHAQLGTVRLPALKDKLAKLGQVGQLSQLSQLNQLSHGQAQEENNHTDIHQRPLYRNTITAIRRHIPYRNLSHNAQGQPLYPKPRIQGQQTAIVVGPQGQVIHTDRDHRIQVQFHWQRNHGSTNGTNTGSSNSSHSRLNNAYGHTHTGAPGNEQSGTWIRVAATFAPIAGANWGSHQIPRIGQEVLIDFIEGDIDRPIVIGSLYNGQGQSNAQHNQINQGQGKATGNAPAWFAGESATQSAAQNADEANNANNSNTSQGHAHNAVLSGIKTQNLATSQSGTGGYNQLVFDDTPEQGRTSLQQHQQAHQGTTELNLGHLKHQSDNQRLQAVGQGIELKTQHSAALRAGQGMLISSHARTNASSHQLDNREAQSQLEQSHQLQQALAKTAEQHKAILSEGKGESGTTTNKAGQSSQSNSSDKQNKSDQDSLPAIQAQAHSLQVISAESGMATNPVTAYSEAHLQFASPAGISISTARNTLIAAGNTSNISANQDINFSSQGSQHHLVKAGISLFTYGKTNQDKENSNDKTAANASNTAAKAANTAANTGIQFHAASGKFSSQSQSDATHLTADKNITVASTHANIQIAANKHVLLTAMGAMLKLEGGNIMLHAPGKVEFKASKKELAGAAKVEAKLPLLPQPEGLDIEKGDQHFVLKSHSGKPVKNRRYRAMTGNKTIEGFTDQNGKTEILEGYVQQLSRFELIDESFDEHFVLKDPLGIPMSRMKYRIKSNDGVLIEGVTDDHGRTSLFTSDKIEDIELLFIEENHAEDEGVN
ncbi:MAG: type VI secretion system tip protein VgrG [Burkholderiaceae bacterium]|nr:type VI secretion system tip protein VgrG [Burkholderiaceae bacterium]